jgi:deazaflavin-dependent oxidoreductase (nitroreductase family)
MALKDFTKALADTDQIEITVTGRRTGQKRSNPVWFVREGETLYLLPVSGSSGDWYRNVRKTPTMRLAARGAEVMTHPSTVTDPGEVDDIVDKFRDKYGADQVRAYFKKLDAAVEVPLR